MYLQIPKYLLRQATTETGTYHLHLITVNATNFPAQTLTSPNLFAEIGLISDDPSYGLITLNTLPSVCSFPIFVSSGEIWVDVDTNYGVLYLEQDDILALRKFNYFILNSLLKVMKDFLVYDNDNAEAGMMLLIPLKKNKNGGCCIDMQMARQYTYINPLDEPTLQQRLDLVVTEESHDRRIVWPWHRSSEVVRKRLQNTFISFKSF